MNGSGKGGRGEIKWGRKKGSEGWKQSGQRRSVSRTCPASSFCPAACFSFTSSTAFSFFLIALARFSRSSADRRDRSTGPDATIAAAAAAAEQK
jgi:hypothetical protein